jgi:hypothetical protein
LRDKNGNVVTAYNTITLTSTNITLNGFTANEVIVGATVAPISTFAVNPLTVSLNGCNITNLTINGTAPAEIFVAGETAIGTITAATVLNLNGDLSETKVIVSLDGISTSIIATDVASISIDALGNINVVAATVDIDIVVADGSNVVPNVVLGAATTGTIDSNKALNPTSDTGETEVTITVTPENVNPGQGTPTTPGAGDETEGTYSPTVPGTPIA